MHINSKYISNLFKKLSVNNADLTGKVALVVGGDRGIGFYTALNLAKMGCKIIIAADNESWSERAVESIRAEVNNCLVFSETVSLIDFYSLSEFKRFVEERFESIDYLILNTEIALYEFLESRDGIERTIQVNHLGQLLITMYLLPLIKKAEKARIIFVSNNAHLDAKIDLPQDLNPTEDTFSWYSLYAKSKLMNVMTAKELSKRLVNDNIIVASVHPGLLATDEINIYYPNTWQGAINKVVSRNFHYYLGRTPDQGSLTTVYVLTDENIKPGAYYDSCELSEHNPQVDDDEICKQLFEESLKIIKFKEESG